MKELKSLTGLRGGAALYVAIFHSLEGNKNPIFQFFINNGYLSVDVFFILSGFVLAYSSGRFFDEDLKWRKYINFMWRRFARIYPMYFFVLTIGFTVVNHFDGKMNYIVGLFLLNLFIGKGYVMLHLWSICSEWMAYLMFPILYRFSKLGIALYWNMFLALLCSIILFIYYYYPNILSLPSKTTFFSTPVYPTLLKCFIEYVLGITACLLYEKTYIPKEINTPLIITVFFSIVALLFLKSQDYFIVLLSAFLIYFLSYENNVLSRLFSSKLMYWLGQISYSLYLLHPIFLSLFKEKYYSIWGENLGTQMLFNFVYLFVVLVMSSITYRFIELPMQIFVNKKNRVLQF